MGWLSNRKFRSVTDSAFEALNQQFESEAKAKTLALAIGHACCPAGNYGDDGNMDAMLSKIRTLPITPCDPETALTLVKQWKKNSIKANELFERIWGFEIDEFIVWLVENVEM